MPWNSSININIGWSAHNKINWDSNSPLNPKNSNICITWNNNSLIDWKNGNISVLLDNKWSIEYKNWNIDIWWANYSIINGKNWDINIWKDNFWKIETKNGSIDIWWINLSMIFNIRSFAVIVEMLTNKPSKVDIAAAIKTTLIIVKTQSGNVFARYTIMTKSCLNFPVLLSINCSGATFIWAKKPTVAKNINNSKITPKTHRYFLTSLSVFTYNAFVSKNW